MMKGKIVLIKKDYSVLSVSDAAHLTFITHEKHNFKLGQEVNYMLHPNGHSFVAGNLRAV